MHDACLESDLDIFPNGDMTEVGERVRRSLISFMICGTDHELDILTGHITLWWSETTCQYLSRHLFWVGHSDI